jgi:ADP-ribose pyrophosphatase YjhB (NUDIX family)
VTGVVIDDGRILLLNQDAGARSWSLPGGKLEDGETLAEALVREMKEETGLDVEPVRLLYVCDNLPAQVVHMTFEARRTGGTVGDIMAGADATPIRRCPAWAGATPGRAASARPGLARHGDASPAGSCA